MSFQSKNNICSNYCYNIYYMHFIIGFNINQLLTKLQTQHLNLKLMSNKSSYRSHKVTSHCGKCHKTSECKISVNYLPYTKIHKYKIPCSWNKTGNLTLLHLFFIYLSTCLFLSSNIILSYNISKHNTFPGNGRFFPGNGHFFS